MRGLLRNDTANSCRVAVVLLASGMVCPALAQQTSTAGDVADNDIADYSDVPEFGGPRSVSGQVKSDDEQKTSAYRFEGLTNSLQPYYDFKQRVNERRGLAFGSDFNLLHQYASDSAGEDNAAGSVLRVYGTWTMLDRDGGSGSLTFKLENRRRLGTDIAPQDLGFEVGYAGLTAITFSDAGALLTNLYWQQSFSGNRVSFVAGIVDTTDYVDVYGIGNPWTDFTILAFSTNPTIPVPNQGVGAAVRAKITDNLYVLAGLADSNGDPGDTGGSFDSFFNAHEYFKHVELGWIGSSDSLFTDNVHLIAWHVDDRKAAGVSDGWGLAASFSRKYNDKWLPFVRAGYSDGGGAILERLVSAGLGYYREDRNDVLGIGLSWGEPSQETFGLALNNQYSAELFYRLQLYQHLTITPDVQLLLNPALNPQEDQIWVVGLRARLNF